MTTNADLCAVQAAPNELMRNSGGAEDKLKLKVTSLSNVTTDATQTRTERKDVRGAQGWQVNGNGDIFKHRHRKTPTGNMPVVELGDRYGGPLLPAFGKWGEVFLDEIVALAFFGLPEAPQLKFHPGTGYSIGPNGMIDGVHVRHLDGDQRNCSVGNLLWIADPEYVAIEDAKLLRGSANARRKGSGPFPWSKHRDDEPRFTGSDSLAGWEPTMSKRAAA